MTLGPTNFSTATIDVLLFLSAKYLSFRQNEVNVLPERGRRNHEIQNGKRIHITVSYYKCTLFANNALRRVEDFMERWPM